MKFDKLDQKMRTYETFADVCVPTEVFMVARIDGRKFTRLTKEKCQFKAPFDERFRDLMVETTRALMNCGIRIVYGYTESDEISLLFDFREQTFGRKLRKLNSTLAAEASAQFSLALGQIATFDCRISQLPNLELVVDYFRWRNEDAARNALNAWCYWTLRKEGFTQQAATRQIEGLSTSAKHELLFEYGINFNDVPLWQKRGVGLYWEEFEKPAVNPKTGEETNALRRAIRCDLELPMRDAYSEFVRKMMQQSEIPG